jgi:hypothetical protein
MTEAMNETSEDSQTQSCCEGVRRPSWKDRGSPIGVVQSCKQGEFGTWEADVKLNPLPTQNEVNTVIQERMSLYGPPEVNLDCIARHWQAYLDNRNSGPLTLQDVCNMMCLAKLSRMARTPEHADSVKDIKAYRQIAESVK